jgi:hypothetical protein
MTTQTIQNKVFEYKQDIAQLEKVVKEWEQDFKIKQVSKLADACYDAFNNLQMALAKIQDADEKGKFVRQCYKGTYQFLTFVENEADIDLCVLLMNKSESFSKLIKHYNKYCSDIENKYSIELDSEKDFGVSIKSMPRSKTVRRK